MSSGVLDGPRGGNPHFFWLAPLVDQPRGHQLGDFDPSARPTVRLVCLSSTAAVACDPAAPLYEASVGSGLAIETDHYTASLPAADLGLVLSGAGAGTTTYRLEVLSPPVTEFGSLVLGFADVQFAADQRSARLLTSPQVIGLAVRNSLPIRFRVDRGALNVAVREETQDEGDDALCRIRCTVAVIEPAATTLVALPGDDGVNATGVLFEPGDLSATSVLIIDERADDATECAPGLAVERRNCYRYLIEPAVPFNNPVRFGICPRNVPLGPGSHWRILKWSAGIVTRPPETDVADFLPCTQPVGFAGRAVRFLASAFVQPLHAGDTRLWGGTVRDFSDLFWAREVDLVVGSVPASAATGSSVPVSVQALAAHPREHNPNVQAPVRDIEVHFEIESGGGFLTIPQGMAVVGSPVVAPDGRTVGLTILTDPAGNAAVDWVVGVAANTLRIQSLRAELPPAQSVIGVMGTGTGFILHEAGVLAAGGTTQGQHMCGLRDDGAAVCWGDNTFGQLGIGDATVPFSALPLPVAGGLSFTRLASGVNHVCGITAAGQTHCWGNNVQSQLGAGPGPHQFAPVPVSGGHSFVTIGADGNTTCGVTAAGAAYCWGDNSSGQIGSGSTAFTEPVPTAVAGSHVFAAISVGSGTTCGLTPQGTALCWGSNLGGQLGNGSVGGNAATPQTAAVGHVFRSITVSGVVVCALNAQGRAHCWGNGFLGSGALMQSLTPLEVSGGHEFVQLTASSGAVCGIVTDGTALCWGNGPLTGTAGGALVPTPVGSGLTFSAIVPAGAATCAITVVGDGYCWGNTQRGFLGDGTIAGSAVPVPVQGSTSFRSLAAGQSIGCAIDAASAAWCWGAGRTGDGSGLMRPLPVQVAGGVVFDTLAAGPNHTCGLDGSGGAWCWGLNNTGQLGDGTTATALAPVAVAGGHQFRSIHAGENHTCAITEAGVMYCWGANTAGQLGNGTTTAMVAAPVQVITTEAFVSAAAGGAHTCALTASGVAHCWGLATGGQTGTGTGVQFLLSPTPVATATTFSTIVARQVTTCAVATDGTAHCWGRVPGTAQLNTTPVPVPGAPPVASITLNGTTACALTANGAAYCWGNPHNALFGTGQWLSQGTPPVLTAVPAVPGLQLSRIALGAAHACGTAMGGGTWCWGWSDAGQLGSNAVVLQRLQPAAVSGGLTFMRP